MLLIVSILILNPFCHFQLSLFNNPDFCQVQHPSNYGYGTADAVAKFYGILSNGGQNKGQKLINAKMVEILKEILVQGQDKMTLSDTKYGRGTSPLVTPTVSDYYFPRSFICRSYPSY